MQELASIHALPADLRRTEIEAVAPIMQGGMFCARIGCSHQEKCLPM